MRQHDVLETIAWAENHFGSLVTNTQCTRREVLRAVNKGLVVSVGDVFMCDDDGFHVDPEIIKEGFVLTAQGKELVEQLKNDHRP